MTLPSINTNSWPQRPFNLIAPVVVLALAALAVPALSSATNNNIDGVRAAVKHGTLNVKGGDGGQRVALRLKAGDPNRIEVDDGNDSVDGGKGNDTAYLGDGNDTFRWDNGEGSDVIEGQDGSDTMLFNGAAANETVTLTANGGRLTFFRTQGNVTMDTDGVETVDFNALGGSDSVTVNDLTGTDVTETNLDLAGTLGGNAADGQLDNVVVNATNGDDNINVTGNGSGAAVTGLATAVSITHTDPTDTLSVNTLAGTDNVLVNGVAGALQGLVDGNPV